MRTRGLTRKAIGAGAAVALAVAIGACGGGDDNAASDSGGDGPIKVGFAVADSGAIAPYDVETAQAAELAVDEINADGGVLGRKLEIVKKNTQSDKALASNVANELVAEGVSAIVASCDFDYGSPAAIVAQGAGIPGISLCASDPKFADTKTIGNLAFSFAPGSDAEASGNAEWAYEKQGWRRVFVLQDESIEYTKALGRYFKARWDGLGGEVVGEDSFPGGDNVNVRAQATKIKQAGDLDFVYIPTWNPGGAAAIRQLRAAGVDAPILGPSALDGELLVQTAGKVSDVYLNPYICYAYCSGSDAPGAEKFAKAFEEKAGKAPTSSYDIAGYNLINALAKAIETAGTTDGAQVAKAMETMGPIESPSGSFEVATAGCHKPTKMPLPFVEVTNGEFKFVENHSVSEIPDVGDGNGCAGS